MEVSEIHENSERLRKINAYLIEQLKKSQLTIGEISTQYDFVLSSLCFSVFKLFILLCYRGWYNRRRVSGTHSDVHYYHSHRRCSSSASSSQTN